MAKTYHVTTDLSGRWVVRKTGSDRPEKAFGTQREAIGFAKQKASDAGRKERVDVMIHQEDGRIRSKDSYGTDPRPPATRKR